MNMNEFRPRKVNFFLKKKSDPPTGILKPQVMQNEKLTLSGLRVLSIESILSIERYLKVLNIESFVRVLRKDSF